MSQLPANPLADFATRATQHRRPASRVEGGYLKFNGKTGEWSFGQEETPVDGEEVLIASQTMMHGFVRWGEVPPAKVFVSVADPLPEKPEPIDGVDNDGKEVTFYAKDARAISGKFVDDALGQFVFNSDSMGGVERLDQLFDEILLKAQDGTEFCYPKVRLENDFYKRSTGKVYKPVFELVCWCDVNGNPASAALEAPEKEEEEQEEAPRRRRRRRA